MYNKYLAKTKKKRGKYFVLGKTDFFSVNFSGKKFFGKVVPIERKGGGLCFFLF